MDVIKLFQQKMIAMGYDAYLIPTSDYHSSEYISSYFKIREFLTGFTGSAGTLLITTEIAYLWVDGRYFIQAAKQTENRPIAIMKMGTPNTPTLFEFLKTHLQKGMKLVFDGKLVNTLTATKIKESIPEDVDIVTNDNLIDSLWEDRPRMPFSLLYKLDEFYTGKSYEEKLALVRESLKEKGIDAFILASLEEQAWLYNLRGKDILHTPVFLAFTVITDSSVTLFIDQRKLDISINQYLDSNEITVKSYNDIYDYVKSLRQKKVLINPNKDIEFHYSHPETLLIK